MNSLLQGSRVLNSFCHYDLSLWMNRSGAQDQVLSKHTPRWYFCTLASLSGCISLTTNLFLQSQSVPNASSNMGNLHLKNISFTKKHGAENKWNTQGFCILFYLADLSFLCELLPMYLKPARSHVCLRKLSCWHQGFFATFSPSQSATLGWNSPSSISFFSRPWWWYFGMLHCPGPDLWEIWGEP